jgi:hypothetical protein
MKPKRYYLLVNTRGDVLSVHTCILTCEEDLTSRNGKT